MSGLVNWWNVAFMFVPDEYERQYPTHARAIAVRFMDSMACLGRNLAMAGALTASFDLGARYGERFGDERGFWNDEQPWWPNADGREVSR